MPQPSLDNNAVQSTGDDDIDAALSELQVTLEGSHINSLNNDITQVPELYDYLRFLKYVIITDIILVKIIRYIVKLKFRSQYHY